MDARKYVYAVRLFGHRTIPSTKVCLVAVSDRNGDTLADLARVNARYELSADGPALKLLAVDAMPMFYVVACAEEPPQPLFAWWGPFSLAVGESVIIETHFTTLA